MGTGYGPHEGKLVPKSSAIVIASGKPYRVTEKDSPGQLAETLRLKLQKGEYQVPAQKVEETGKMSTVLLSPQATETLANLEGKAQLTKMKVLGLLPKTAVPQQDPETGQWGYITQEQADLQKLASKYATPDNKIDIAKAYSEGVSKDKLKQLGASDKDIDIARGITALSTQGLLDSEGKFYLGAATAAGISFATLEPLGITKQQYDEAKVTTEPSLPVITKEARTRYIGAAPEEFESLSISTAKITSKEKPMPPVSIIGEEIVVTTEPYKPGMFEWAKPGSEYALFGKFGLLGKKSETELEREAQLKGFWAREEFKDIHGRLPQLGELPETKMGVPKYIEYPSYIIPGTREAYRWDVMTPEEQRAAIPSVGAQLAVAGIAVGGAFYKPGPKFPVARYAAVTETGLPVVKGRATGVPIKGIGELPHLEGKLYEVPVQYVPDTPGTIYALKQPVLWKPGMKALKVTGEMGDQPIRVDLPHTGIIPQTTWQMRGGIVVPKGIVSPKRIWVESPRGSGIWKQVPEPIEIPIGEELTPGTTTFRKPPVVPIRPSGAPSAPSTATMTPEQAAKYLPQTDLPPYAFERTPGGLYVPKLTASPYITETVPPEKLKETAVPITVPQPSATDKPSPILALISIPRQQTAPLPTTTPVPSLIRTPLPTPALRRTPVPTLTAPLMFDMPPPPDVPVFKVPPPPPPPPPLLPGITGISIYGGRGGTRRKLKPTYEKQTRAIPKLVVYLPTTKEEEEEEDFEKTPFGKRVVKGIIPERGLAAGAKRKIAGKPTKSKILYTDKYLGREVTPVNLTETKV
jgi:hypothetical protein